MVKLNWTPQSKNDLLAIAEFIAQNPKNMQDFKFIE